MNDLIIERPDLQTLSQRYGYSFLTLMMWLFYLYLWLPLITLGAWGLDFNFAYVHMILLEGYRALLHVLVIYLLIIVLMMVTLISWSQINLHRFGGLDRRKARLPVTTEELSTEFAVPIAIIRSWQVSKSIVIHHNDAGEVIPSVEMITRMKKVATLLATTQTDTSASAIATARAKIWGGLKWPAQGK